MEKRQWRMLVRILSDEASPAEREEFARWVREDAARGEEVERLRALWNATGTLPELADPAPAWSRVAERTGISTPARPRVPLVHRPAAPRPPSIRTPAWRGPLVRVAALLVLALGIGLLWQPAGDLYRDRVLTRTVVTGKGERVQLVLDDGSRVLLGVDSRLRYPRRFGRASREVRLEGVAYFEVARDPGRTFTVHSADAVTRVLGTKFTVRDYPGAEPVRVAVTEGRVAVQPRRAGGGVPVRTAVLVRGQAAEVARPGAAPVVQPTLARPDLAWTQGTIAFENAAVPLVLAELGRWYEVQIQVHDPALAARHLTISFEKEPLDVLLREIAAALDARVERRGGVFILAPAVPARTLGPAGATQNASL
ncbi:MAG TPA: FecR domain-containing protein [Longimicrobium sp.]|nr:FecR domain-containing protein [Longimicrobium sp.]